MQIWLIFKLVTNGMGQFQASQLGLGTQWAEIKKKYIEANQLVRQIFGFYCKRTDFIVVW
jgi:pyruvate carboxylase